MSTTAAFSELYDAITARFEAFWTASGTALLGPGAPDLVRYPDQRFDEDRVDRKVGYLALHILDGAGVPASLSRVATLHRWAGIFDVQIFRGRETGQRKSRLIADAIAGAFALQTLTTASGGFVRMRETNLADAGEVGDWTQHNCWTSFDYDAVFAIT